MAPLAVLGRRRRVGSTPLPLARVHSRLVASPVPALAHGRDHRVPEGCRAA